MSGHRSPTRKLAVQVVLSALLGALAVAHAAPPFETWHSTDFQLHETPRVEWTFHTQFRTRARFSSLPYLRVGPVVRLRPTSWLSVQGGYWLQEGRSFRNWEESQRIFAHVEVPLYQGKAALFGRASMERFFVGDGPGYNRQRYRLVALLPGRWQTILSHEWFFDPQGLLSWRPGAGVRRRLSPRSSLDVTYFLDVRRPTAGGARHVLQTTLRIDRKPR